MSATQQLAETMLRQVNEHNTKRRNAIEAVRTAEKQRDESEKAVQELREKARLLGFEIRLAENERSYELVPPRWGWE